MEEQEQVEEEYNKLWSKITTITEEIRKVERLMVRAGEKFLNTDKEERKDIANLRRELHELEEKKRVRKAEWEAEVREYTKQQRQILTREWILRQKRKLLKRRVKEAAAIRAEKEQCEKLIKSCYLILKSVNVSGDYVLKFQSAKRKKKKRKEPLGLDKLKDQFECLSISAPEGIQDLEECIVQLKERLSEINARPLTETLEVDGGKNSSSEYSWSSGS
eukprot:TRINITY_DN11206_c0_g1_i4.p1 TRINITY_DN11206_c0_g1~~TRINITY_DN11206_c0_g1_i4.p1  ORF type:complete len:219 (+),score=66.09 TRINITY_DN11206_c0_g1_i4:721-1377(+)